MKKIITKMITFITLFLLLVCCGYSHTHGTTCCGQTKNPSANEDYWCRTEAMYPPVDPNERRCPYTQQNENL